MAKKMIIHAKGLMKAEGPDKIVNLSPITVPADLCNLLNNYVIITYEGKRWYLPWHVIELIEEINE